MIRYILLTLSTFTLISCGGGGGGGGDSTGDTNVPEERPFGAVTGVAHDGPISGATVTAYLLNADGSKGAELGASTSDDSGIFDIPVQSVDQILLIETLGGTYTEESTGTSVSLTTTSRRNIPMRSYVNYVSGTEIQTSITPYTNLAAGLVEFLLGQGTSLDEAITTAYAQIDTMVGFNVRTTIPLDVTDIANEFSGVTDSVKYAYALAGFAQLTENLSVAAGQAPHVLYTSYDFAAIMYGDIAADGLLDGFGYAPGTSSTPTTLEFIGLEIVSSVYREQHATSIIEFVESDENKIAHTANDILPFSLQIAASTDDIFDQKIPEPIDTVGPTISDIQDTNFRGEISLEFEVDDFVGVNQVTFYFDGSAVSNAADPQNPQFTLNTDDYEIGSHTIRLVATDNLGNETIRDFAVFFAPESGTISGHLMDGLSSGGIVNFYSVKTNGTKNELLDSISPIDSFYSANLALLAQPLLIEFTEATYTELASGKNEPFRSQSLTALIDFVPNQIFTENVNILSHAATSLAQSKISNGLTVSESIISAKTQIISVVGFNYSITSPIYITDTINEFSDFNDDVAAELYSAAISQYAFEFDSHDQYRSIEFAQVIFSDLQDGLLDGQNLDVEVSFAGNIISAQTYREKISASMIKFVNSDRYSIQLQIPAILPFALSVQNSTHEIFDGELITEFDNVAPTITIETGSDNFNETRYTISASDFTGIETVEYFLDGVLQGAGSQSPIEYAFTTTDFNSGNHTFSVTANDYLGNTRTVTEEVFFIPQRGNITGISEISGGTVTLYTVDSHGNLLTQIGTTSTSGDGTYSLSVQQQTQPLLVEITSGSILESATGRTVSLVDGDVFSAFINYVEASVNVLNVNLWTHGATGLARYSVAQNDGSLLSDTIIAGYSTINDLLGLDVTTVNVIDLSDEANEFAPLNDPTNLALINAGVSQYTAEIGEAVGDVAHARYTTLSYSNTLYNDAISDGLLNGAGTTSEEVYGTLQIANTTISANSYRSSIAGGIIAYVQGEQIALGRETTEYLPLALNVQNNANAVFAGIPTVSFDSDGPSIGVPGGTNEYDDTVEILFTSSDFSGVAEVEFRLDGIVIGTASNPDDPTISINTENYTDGDHTLSLDSTDVLGNETNTVYLVYFLPPIGDLAGAAHDGPIIGGTVTAYEYGTNNVYGSTTTDSIGDYSLQIQELDSTVSLEVTGGRYIEEFSGRTISLSGGQSLKGNTFYEAGADIELSLTQYTHWSTCLAEYLVEDQGYTVGNAIRESSETFTNLAESEISSTKPLDITNPNNFTTFLTPGHEYGYVLAGWSGVAEAIAIENGAQPHSSTQYTAIYLADVICTDIRFNGLMDGLAAPTIGNSSGQLYIGTTALSAHYYRTILGQKILEAASNDAINQAGIPAPELLEIANAISTNPASIFAGVTPRQVDIEGPIISSTVSEGTLFAGTIAIPFDIEDPIGVSGVDFYVNGEFLANGNLTDLNAHINTLNYSDGSHTIRVVGRDSLLNESEFSLDFTVINSGAAVTISSSNLVNNRTYISTGTFSSVGAPIDTIVVNGVTAVIDAVEDTWSAELSLAAGSNNVTAQISDTLGNTNSTSILVGVDITSPTISGLNTNALFTSGGSTLSTCNPAILLSGTAIIKPVCLDPTKTSLNGIPITASLSSEGYIMINTEIIDQNNTGVFSPINELSVEYQYLRDGDTIVNWKNVSRLDLNENIIYFPITTENLGDTFFQTSKLQDHTVLMRVTDRAGNSSTTTTTINIDVYTEELSSTQPRVTNPEIFNTTFPDRSDMQYETANLEYTVSNTTDLPYYVRLHTDNDHDLDHSWHTGRRYNLTSEVRNETWQRATQIVGMASLFNVFAVFGEKTGYIPSTGVYNWNGSSWQWTTPPGEVVSPAVIKDSDNPIRRPTTAWFDRTIDASYFTYAPADSTCIISVDYVDELSSTPGVLNGVETWQVGYTQYNSANIGSNCQGWDTGSELSSFANLLQLRYAYSWRSNDGYPRNQFTEHSENTAFTIDDYNVYIGEEIQPDVGDEWYLLPANTSIRVVRSVYLPTFTIYDDQSIAANDATVPYSVDALLDNQFTWNFDTSMTIERSIAPSAGFTDSVTVTSQLIDPANLSFSISR